jgi:hypothetical protein
MASGCNYSFVHNVISPKLSIERPLLIVQRPRIHNQKSWSRSLDIFTFLRSRQESLSNNQTNLKHLSTLLNIQVLTTKTQNMIIREMSFQSHALVIVLFGG